MASSRSVLYSQMKRNVTRTSAVTSMRCSAPYSLKYSNNKAAKSPTLALVKPLRCQVESLTPRYSHRPLPVDVSSETTDKNPNKLSKTFIPEGQQGKVAEALDPVECGSWLERFGGPGKLTERAGTERGVLMDVGEDGNGYLRVLI